MSNFDDINIDEINIEDIDFSNPVEKTLANSLKAEPFDCLTAMQTKAIELKLINGYPKTKIAKELGVTKNTLDKWFRDETFLTIFEESKKEIMNDNQSRFHSLVPLAIDRLQDIIENGEDEKAVMVAVKEVLGNSGLIGDNKDKTSGKTQIIINTQPIESVVKVREMKSDIIDVTPVEDK